MTRYRTAADEERFSLHYEETHRKPLLTPWQFACVCWFLLAVVFTVFAIVKGFSP